MKQFKIGDKVKIISAQEDIEDMQNMIGMVCTIYERPNKNGYTLKEDRCKYIWNSRYLIKNPVGMELE